MNDSVWQALCRENEKSPSLFSQLCRSSLCRDRNDYHSSLRFSLFLKRNRIGRISHFSMKREEILFMSVLFIPSRKSAWNNTMNDSVWQALWRENKQSFSLFSLLCLSCLCRERRDDHSSLRLSLFLKRNRIGRTFLFSMQREEILFMSVLSINMKKD